MKVLFETPCIFGKNLCHKCTGIFSDKTSIANVTPWLKILRAHYKTIIYSKYALEIMKSYNNPLSTEPSDCLLVCLHYLLAAIFYWNNAICYCYGQKLKGSRAKPWRLMKFRPKKAHLGNRDLSGIQKMYGGK
jgi:hypothetical protein